MILVTGAVTGKPDSIAEMLSAARAHVQRSRKEDSCISHDVSVDADDPLKLHFVERWRDAAALKAHFRVPESRAFWRLLQDLAADPGAMQVYDAGEIRL
jgi:quinol monooxygenase YgiN